MWRTTGRHDSWHVLTIAALLAATAAYPTAAQVDDTTAVSAWPPQLQPALEVYDTGDYAAAQRFCVQFMDAARAPALRREAAALHALASLRMPARDDRVSGLGRLDQLGQEDPTLLERPECQLARGIAQASLNQTAAALDQLDRAFQGFSRRGDQPHVFEAACALVAAWARHSEWSTTPPRFGIPEPSSAEEAHTCRLAHIEQTRARIEQMLGSTAALARMDLILARYLIGAGDERGPKLLEHVARSALVTPAVVEAAVAVAEHYEQDERWADALALYRRAQAERLGDLSRLAEERANAISRPQIELKTPAGSPVGSAVPLELRVRNLGAVQLEVRRVALGDWLSSRQGRFAEGALPTVGSVQMTRALDTRMGVAHAWWQAEDVSFTAAPGAYVAVARARDEGGHEHTAKRLVIVSDFHAVAFAGQRDALIWATWRASGEPGAGLAPTLPQLRARFWIHGSFVPTQPQFKDGTALFALPAEARLLRDRRWVCLVEAGDQLALCRGRLPAGDRAAALLTPRVALVSGPPLPQVGQTVHLAGCLLPADAGGGLPEDDVPVLIEIRDSLDTVLFAEEVSVSAAGTFAVHVPICPGMAGKTLRAIARQRGSVLENIRGRHTFDVAAENLSPALVTCRVPSRFELGAEEITGTIEAVYPWGTPLAGAESRCIVRAVRLPGTDEAVDAVAAHPRHRLGLSDARGRYKFTIPVPEFELPAGALAISARASVTGWDGRDVGSAAEAVVSSCPVPIWITPEPARPCRGQTVQFAVGWFDAGGSAVSDRPRLTVRGDGAVAAELHLSLSPTGLLSEPWTPKAAGEYEIELTLPTVDAEPLRHSVALVVTEGTPGATGASDVVRCVARLTPTGEQSAVSVDLRDAGERPLLVLVEAGDPLAAQVVRPHDGRATAVLPVENAAAARVLVVGIHNNRAEVLADTPVLPSAAQDLRLRIELAQPTQAPGVPADVSVHCTRAGEEAARATLVARLIHAADSGYANWQPGELRKSDGPSAGWLALSSSLEADLTLDEEGTGRPVPSAVPRQPPHLWEALYGGTTLWADSMPLDGGTARLRVPLPPDPGLYRLIVWARGQRGASVVDSRLLDARRGVQVTLSVPGTLTTGDRTVAALSVSNRSETETAVHASLRGGGGLHIESVRVEVDGEPVAAEANGAALRWAMPATSRASVIASVEATNAGEASFKAEVSTPTSHQVLSEVYQVVDVAEPAEPPTAASYRALHLSRTVMKLIPPDPPDPTSPPAERVRRARTQDWPRVLLNPDERVAPGHLLLVREEFALDQGLDGVYWVQRAPATCCTGSSDIEQLPQIGSAEPVRFDRLGFRANRLEAGRHVHEYILVAIRPGTCLLPPPTITAAGRAVPLQVTSGERRVGVSGRL
ncbi:MAG: hypothetical protein KKB50_09810 [Planctomycetes bacterium]|nr:hypothetical protein [Planctomycetota bacterium]